MTDKAVAVIEKKLMPVMKDIETLVVKDEKSEEKAGLMLSQLNLIGDKMKEAKAKVYDPAWATVVAIREEWKPKETLLKTAIDSVRAKMNKYRTEAKAIADAEAAKIEARIGEGKGKLKVDTAVRQIEQIDKPTGSVSTAAGVVKYKTTPNFEVMDMTMLPIKYHLSNDVEIRIQMKKGVKLPGVRYFTEEVPQNFR